MFLALMLVAVAGAVAVSLMLGDGIADWAAMSLTAVVLLAAGFAVLGMQRWFVRRWLPSEWRYRRVLLGLFTLLCLGALAANLHDVVVHGDGVTVAFATPIVVLLVCWSWAQQGPAGGRSLRRAASAKKACAGNWTAARARLIVIFAVLAGLLGALRSIGVPAAVIGAVLLVAWGALSLYYGFAMRRERRALGLTPTCISPSPGPSPKTTSRPGCSSTTTAPNPSTAAGMHTQANAKNRLTSLSPGA